MKIWTISSILSAFFVILGLKMRKDLVGRTIGVVIVGLFESGNCRGHEDEIKIVTEVEMDDKLVTNFTGNEEEFNVEDYKPAESYSDSEINSMESNETDILNNNSTSQQQENDTSVKIETQNNPMPTSNTDEVNKIIEVTLKEKHVHSEESVIKLIEKGAQSIIEPSLANADSIYGGEYTIVFCQISTQNTQMFIKLRNIYLATVGELFDKFNKDVIFLFSKYEEHHEISQLWNIPYVNSLGVFNPKSKEPLNIVDISKLSDEDLNELGDDLEELLNTRVILSEAELNSSNVPLNPNYPRYREVVPPPQQIQDSSKEEVMYIKYEVLTPKETAVKEEPKKDYDFESALNLVNNLKQLYSNIADNSKKLEKLNKELKGMQNLVDSKLKKS